MSAIRRKYALRPGVGTSAAKPLNSAAKRMHVSACFWTLSVSDTALLLKGGSACLSQSSAGQKTVPMINLKWGRVGHLARIIFPIFEHVHGITPNSNDKRTHGSTYPKLSKGDSPIHELARPACCLPVRRTFAHWRWTEVKACEIGNNAKGCTTWRASLVA
jgi:hypothetical protein